jgi:hypothetical protein
MEVMNTHQYKKTPSRGLAILTHCIQENLAGKSSKVSFLGEETGGVHCAIDNYEIACREISTMITRS